MFNVFSGQLQPYIKATEKVAVSSKDAAIARTHSDFETLRESGEIKDWIETQPMFLREPMSKVYESGEAEDVVELITRYKKESGTSAPAPEAPKEKVIDPKVAERVRNLQIVKNKQKGINATKDTVGDPDDFSSAFKEALANIK
jgi:hypothetical protein